MVPLGINLTGYERATKPDDVFRVGYFARIAPEKGLLALAEAYPIFRRRTGQRAGPSRGRRLPVARPRAVSRGREAQPGEDRDSRTSSPITARWTATASSRSCARSTCCPCRRRTTSRRACSCSKRWRAACRWSSRARGSFTEMVERTGGGLLVKPDDPEALAEGLYALWSDPGATSDARRSRLGRRPPALQHPGVDGCATRRLRIHDQTAGAPCCKSLTSPRAIPPRADR